MSLIIFKIDFGIWIFFILRITTLVILGVKGESNLNIFTFYLFFVCYNYMYIFSLSYNDIGENFPLIFSH